VTSTSEAASRCTSSRHLGLSVRERRAQEALLLAADILRDTVRNDPVLVCGDFNYLGSRPVPSLVRQALADVAMYLGTPARTYHSRLPFMRLDRIYVDAGVGPLELRAHRTALAMKASDHLPLVLRFRAPISAALPTSPPVQLLG
jgi:endonuclease/exonuclease/phosphatase family metal-dependent hydrolase